MASALRARTESLGGNFCAGDDNEVDARWLLYFALAVDEGSRSWTFGWQLKTERKEVAKSKRADRRQAQKARISAARSDGLNRLNRVLAELGEKLAPRAALRAVIHLGKNGHLTLKLKSSEIEGSVLKNGQLRWQISRTVIYK